MSDYLPLFSWLTDWTTHDSKTTPKRRYCSLYGGRCSWDARISKYESWTGAGENIAMTYSDAAGDPMAALAMWIGSSGHCSNLFSGNYNHMGTGARGRYWTQDFATRSAYTSNPFYDGTHYRHSTRTNGKLRFMVSFKASAAPQVRLLNGIDRLTGRIHAPPTLYTTPTPSSPSACTSTA